MELNEQILKIRNLMGVLGENVGKDTATCSHCGNTWKRTFGDDNSDTCYQCGFNDKTKMVDEVAALRHWSDKITQPLDEFGTPMPQNFNVEYFKTLKSFAKRVNYCKQTLGKPVGVGSSRVVFDIDNNMVLKLARNAKGIAQNSVESEDQHQSWYDHIVSKVIESDTDNDEWLIAEKAKKISPKRFQELTGIPFEKLQAFLTIYYDLAHGNKKNGGWYSYYREKLSPEEEEAYYDNEFTSSVAQMMNDNDMPAGDFCRINSWGEVNRNGKPTAVLIDYGFTNDVEKNHYTRKAKAW